MVWDTNFQKKRNPVGCVKLPLLQVVSLPVGVFHSLLLIDHLLTRLFGAASLNKEQADDFVAGNFPLKNGDSIDCKMFL